MNLAWQSKALELLAGMASSADNAWNEQREKVYLHVLNNIGQRWSQAAVSDYVLRSKWRPSPAELRERAADLASVRPPKETIRAEIWHKVNTTGYEHNPRWHHIASQYAAEAMGEWKKLISRHWWLESNGRRDFDKLFDESWETAISAYREDVCTAINRNEDGNDAITAPFRIGQGPQHLWQQPKLQEQDNVPRITGLRDITKHMPPEIRENIKKIGSKK
jgi:hypothetical protein